MGIQRACAVEGCERPARVVSAARLLCEEHAAESLRCAVEGCDCWADAALGGRLLCRHHLVELRQTGRFSAAQQPDAGGTPG